MWRPQMTCHRPRNDCRNGMIAREERHFRGRLLRIHQRQCQEPVGLDCFKRAGLLRSDGEVHADPRAASTNAAVRYVVVAAAAGGAGLFLRGLEVGFAPEV